MVVFSGPFPVKTDCVLAEWSVGPGVPQVVDPLSRREILRIAEWGAEHNADTIMFDPNAPSESPAYGKMFITTGDGGNHPKPPDPYHQAQDPARALGKLLRIDPLKQANGAAYGVPADNPFIGKAGYLPEIWALGFRHPQNLSFDRGGTGAMIVTDIGQSNIEEVNLGVRGGNYGWPYREGTFVTEGHRLPALRAAARRREVRLSSKYPPAKPGALGLSRSKRLFGDADAAPASGPPKVVVSARGSADPAAHPPSPAS